VVWQEQEGLNLRHIDPKAPLPFSRLIIFSHTVPREAQTHQWVLCAPVAWRRSLWLTPAVAETIKLPVPVVSKLEKATDRRSAEGAKYILWRWTEFPAGMWYKHLKTSRPVLRLVHTEIEALVACRRHTPCCYMTSSCCG
jgi:hypothetical protein